MFENDKRDRVGFRREPPLRRRSRLDRLVRHGSVLVLLIAATGAAAQDAQMPPLYGAGANRCQTLLDLQKDGRASAENNWITGYVTALVDNLAALRPHADVILSQRASAWFVQFCRQHPGTSIGDAVRVFDIELRKGLASENGVPPLFRDRQ